MEGNMLDFNSWTQPREENHQMNLGFEAFREDNQRFDPTEAFPSGSHNTPAITTLPFHSITPTLQIIPNIPQSSVSAAVLPPSPVQIFESPTITLPAVVYCSWCGQVTSTAFTSGSSVGNPYFFNKDRVTNTWNNSQLRWNNLFGPRSVVSPFIGNTS